MHPFSQDNPGTGQAGETAILQLVRQRMGNISPPPPEGIGDDCATWQPPPGETLLLTTDPVILGKHFDASHAPGLVGAKLLKRNLSDIAAMGGQPGPAVLALAMGPDLQLEWLTAFLDGLAEACRKYKVPLAGGDIAAANPGTFCATLTQAGSAVNPVTRTGAQDGSPILVTGTLGGSLSGRHLHFEPRLKEGQWLASQGVVASMIDLSDGMARDLLELIPSCAQAALDLPAIPINEEVRQAGNAAIQSALCDGEDYELLFTLAPGTVVESFIESWPFPTPLHRVGKIQQGDPEGILVDNASGNILHPGDGYEHFMQ